MKKITPEDIKILSLLSLRNKDLPDKYKVSAERGFCGYAFGKDKVICFVCLIEFTDNPSNQTEWEQHLLSHLDKVKSFI